MKLVIKLLLREGGWQVGKTADLSRNKWEILLTYYFFFGGGGNRWCSGIIPGRSWVGDLGACKASSLLAVLSPQSCWEILKHSSGSQTTEPFFPGSS